VAGEFATYALVTRPGSLPGAVLAAWYASWPWYPTLALALVFTPLLFPTGRLLSPRWRPVAWLAGAATAAFTETGPRLLVHWIWECMLVGGPGLGVLGRGPVAEGAVGPEGVVLDPPLLDQHLGLQQGY
jgi:hypothetical protein